MTNDLMELGKDRVGEGMQLLPPELPIALNALLGVLIVVFGAWQIHDQMIYAAFIFNVVGDEYEGIKHTLIFMM